MNNALFLDMISIYNKHSFTHEYIWVFTKNGLVYMAVTDSSYVPAVCVLDKASRGAGYSIRFKPNRAQKNLLLSHGAQVLCSEEFFNDMVENSRYNKGEIFEKLITEKCGQTWFKDNVPFTKGGDLTVNGIAYQIKFEKATFCNEKSLANLEW